MKGDLLLIIDMQNVYAKGGEWECLDTEGAAANILRVVESGAADSAIITKFIADKKARGVWADYNQKYKAINDDKNANELLPQIAALSGRFKVYQKSKYSSLSVPQIREAALKAVKAVCDNVADDGTVLNVSSGTAMGMNAEHYKNIIIHPMAYCQSLALLALIEALDA